MTQVEKLSNREREVVHHLLQGKSNKLIALALGISGRTVEFHLKNIYAKFHVSSRIELILKLGNTTGRDETGKPGYSTVDGPGERAENRDTLNPRMDWGTSFRESISVIGEELQMKNLFVTMHVLVGVITALFTGFLWITVFRHFGHMSLEAIMPWIVPLVVILTVLGLSIGLVGRRNGGTLPKVFFGTLFGTGFGAFAMIPLVGFVVYPLGKFVEWLGLIDRSAISTDVASTLIIAAMLIMWLIAGIAAGIVALRITIKKPKTADLQRHGSEHGFS